MSIIDAAIAEELGGRAAPAVLLPYQQRWIADRADVKVAEKSRRIGLTWGQASDDVLFAATKGKGAVKNDVLYISYNQDMTRDYINTCAFWAKHFDKACGAVQEFIFEDDDPDKEIKAFRIDFASGSSIIALSSRPTNLRGKQGRVVIDEAAFVDNLGELFKAALALLMWGGQVVVISTHNGEDNYFNEVVEDIRAGRKPYSLHRITLDDALNDGLYRRICLVTGKDWTPKGEADWRAQVVAKYGDDSDEELFCIPSKGGGAYLPLNLIEAAMRPEIPVVRWSPPAKDFVDWPDDTRYRDMAAWCVANLLPLLARMPKDKPSWFGQDFGRLVDLSVTWPVQEMPGLTWWTPFVLELRDCPFAQQEQALFFVGDLLPKRAGGALDRGGNGAFLAERARQRFGGPDLIHEIQLSSSWYLENMPPFKAAFEDRTFPIPRDGDIRDDLRAIRKVKGVPMVPRDARSEGKDKGKRHGDAAVAGCLALYAARNIVYGGEMEVLTGPVRQASTMFSGY